jgi:hypothetical protein
VEFEWDEDKVSENLRKHKVSFAEAATVFADPLGATISDPDHSAEEDRLITIGLSIQSRLLIVSHRDSDHRVRIISARRLTRNERKAYEEKTKR